MQGKEKGQPLNHMWKKRFFRRRDSLIEENQALYDSLVSMEQERDNLLRQPSLLQQILNLLDSGLQLLGIRKFGENVIIVGVDSAKVQGTPYAGMADIIMYRLPVEGGEMKIGWMWAWYCNEYTVFIKDWYSKEEDKGYGSYLMETALTFFRNAGMWSVKGVISSVDFDHLDKLLHFYKKFGFDISKADNEYIIDLSLFSPGIYDRRSECIDRLKEQCHVAHRYYESGKETAFCAVKLIQAGADTVEQLVSQGIPQEIAVEALRDIHRSKE